MDSVRIAVEKARAAILAESASNIGDTAIRDAIIAHSLQEIRDAMGPHYRKVINATGIILHTGLGPGGAAGRRPAADRGGTGRLLAPAGRRRRPADAARRDAPDRAAPAAAHRGRGGHRRQQQRRRHDDRAQHGRPGREVIVSRGQLVEIGGSFRLPDVMDGQRRASWSRSARRTRPTPATTKRRSRENTAAILRVHPSNYKITGFTSEVPLAELVEIAHAAACR